MCEDTDHDGDNNGALILRLAAGAIGPVELARRLGVDPLTLTARMNGKEAAPHDSVMKALDVLLEFAAEQPLRQGG